MNLPGNTSPKTWLLLLLRLAGMMVIAAASSESQTYRVYEWIGVLLLIVCPPVSAVFFVCWAFASRFLLIGFPSQWGLAALCAGAVIAILMPSRLLEKRLAGDAYRNMLEYYGLPARLIICLGMMLGLLALTLRDFPWPVGLGWLVAFAVAWLRLPPITAENHRKTAANAALLAFSMLLSFCVLEAGARVLASRQLIKRSDFWMMHPQAGFTLKPGASGNHSRAMPDGKNVEIPTIISTQGLRDREYGPPSPGEFRILMLGDSFTFGWGMEVEKGMAKALERRFHDAGFTNVSVINGGVGSYGPWQERYFLEERCLPLKPNLVLHQLFPGNDIENTLARNCEFPEAYNVSVQQDFLRWRNEGLFPVRLEVWLKDHVMLYRMGLALSRRGDLISSILFRTKLFDRRIACALPPAANRPFNLEVGLRNWYPLLEKGWKLFERDVLEIRAICENNGVLYASFCLPDMCNITDNHWHWATKDLGRAAYERYKDTSLTESFYARENIPFVSLKQAIEQCPWRDELFFSHDGHLTEKGVELVTRFQYDFILANYLRNTPEQGAPAP